MPMDANEIKALIQEALPDAKIEIRDLAGDDDDAPRLLEAALDVASHRVVVKRPRRAPPIEGPAPHHMLEGKTSRYDLYVHRALK